MILAVRHHHERTHPLFAEANAELLGADKVLTFTGQPFFNTLEKMLETLVEEDDEYFLTIDADMLVTDSETVLAYLTRQYDYVDFHVFDKFRGIYRGGPHLYSKRMIHAMAETRRKIAHEQEFIKRPEGYTKMLALQRDGLAAHIERQAVAHHDYAQYRKDLLYKYIYRGWKTFTQEAQKWFRQWEKEQNADFLVARKAIEWSWKHPLKLFPQGIIKTDSWELFNTLGVEEKPSHIDHSELPPAILQILSQSAKIPD